MTHTCGNFALERHSCEAIRDNGKNGYKILQHPAVIRKDGEGKYKTVEYQAMMTGHL